MRVMRDEPYALTALKVLRRAQETVEAGVTTVRDLGGRDYAEFAVRRAVAEGLFPGPRILGAGRPVCMTGGHGNCDRPRGRRPRRRAQGGAGAAQGGGRRDQAHRHGRGDDAGSGARLAPAYPRGDARGHRGGDQGGPPDRRPRPGLHRHRRCDRGRHHDHRARHLSHRRDRRGHEAQGCLSRGDAGRARRRSPPADWPRAFPTTWSGSPTRLSPRTWRASDAPTRRSAHRRRRRFRHSPQPSRQPAARARAHGQVRHDAARGHSLGDVGGGGGARARRRDRTGRRRSCRRSPRRHGRSGGAHRRAG